MGGKGVRNEEKSRERGKKENKDGETSRNGKKGVEREKG